MTNKILVAIVITLNIVMLTSLTYFIFDTHQSAKRIDAMVRTHLEQRLQK